MQERPVVVLKGVCSCFAHDDRLAVSKRSATARSREVSLIGLLFMVYQWRRPGAETTEKPLPRDCAKASLRASPSTSESRPASFSGQDEGARSIGEFHGGQEFFRLPGEGDEVMAELDRHLAAFERNELSLDQLLVAVDRMVAEERGDGSRLLGAIRTQPWRSRLEDGVRLAVEHRVVAAEAAARARLTGVTASRRPDTDRTQVALAEPRLPGVGDVIKQRFELVEELGAGGMGKVFKALDRVRAEARDREPYVAIKILSQALQQHAISAIALQREAKKTLRLSHPSVVHVYDFDRDGPLMYMTMEYLSGQSLDKMLREPGFTGLAVEDVLTILRPLAAALTHAHQQGLVHSDFKPSNVFITDDGRVKIIDFGIARAVHRAGGDADHTVFDPSKLGALTPPYASIEQIDGCDPDPRDDIYALACVNYELLTGRHPFNRASSRRAMAERMEPVRPPKLSRRQWEGLKRALAFQREKRTPSVEAFVASLEPRRSRRRWLIALVALVVLAAIAGAAWYLGPPAGRLSPAPAAPGGEQGEFAPPEPVRPEATRSNLWPPRGSPASPASSRW